LILTLVRGGIFEDNVAPPISPPSTPSKPHGTIAPYGLKTSLAIATLSGLLAVYTHAGSITVVALGFSQALLLAWAFQLIERAHGAMQPYASRGSNIIYSANGLLTPHARLSPSKKEQWLSVIRDVAAAGAVTTGVFALSLENMRLGGLAYYAVLGEALGDQWVFGQAFLSIGYAFGVVFIRTIVCGTLLLMVSTIDHLAFTFLHLPLLNSMTWRRPVFPLSRNPLTTMFADTTTGSFPHELRAYVRCSLLSIDFGILTVAPLVCRAVFFCHVFVPG
jgi:hypothetical protein